MRMHCVSGIWSPAPEWCLDGDSVVEKLMVCSAVKIESDSWSREVQKSETLSPKPISATSRPWITS